MSSEGKGSDPTWQDTMNADWDLSADEDLPVDQEEQQELEEFPPPSDSLVDVENPFHTAEPLIVESDAVGLSTPTPLRLELWEYVRQYLWLVGVPLLFGGCTCLIVLPLITLQRTVAPPSTLWLVTFVIIIIAVAQGFALYKAGTNINFWMAGTIGGFCLFVLLGCFVIFGPLPGFILLVLLALIVIILARRAIHPVPDGYVDLVSSLGKYSHPLSTGFNILWPWEEVTHQVDIREKTWTCPVQRVPASPTRDITVRANIAYQLLPEGAHLAVTDGQNWEQTLQQTFQQLIGEVAVTLSLDDVIAWQQSTHARSSASSLANNADWWNQSSAYVLQQVQDKVIQWCVQVNDVRIDEVSLAQHQTPAIDAEPARPDAETIAQTKGTTSPVDAVSSRPHMGWHGGPTPEGQKKATQWLQDTKEEIAFNALEKAYRAVQQGTVTVPDAIRDLADKFDAVARDPQKSKAFKYDAPRAARLLYKRAQECEELEATANVDLLESFYDDTTATMRRPSDENIIY